MKRCDLCGERPGVLTDRTVVNNGAVEFCFCERCYDEIRRSGMTTLEVMSLAAAKSGRECPVCGMTAEKFAEGFLFGCPECYKHMRSVAMSAAAASQGGRIRHVGKAPGGKF